MNAPARRARRASLAWAALIALTGGLLLVLAFVPIGRSGSGATDRSLIGQPAPRLAGVDLDGRTHAIGPDPGTADITWVNFWAISCVPCRTEMPAMQRLSEAYGERLLVLGVNHGEDRGSVEDFLRRYAISYPILLDPNLEHFARWSAAAGLPRHYFVDADGVVVREVVGELAPADMVRLLEELIGPPA